MIEQQGYTFRTETKYLNSHITSNTDTRCSNNWSRGVYSTSDLILLYPVLSCTSRETKIPLEIIDKKCVIKGCMGLIQFMNMKWVAGSSSEERKASSLEFRQSASDCPVFMSYIHIQNWLCWPKNSKQQEAEHSSYKLSVQIIIGYEKLKPLIYHRMYQACLVSIQITWPLCIHKNINYVFSNAQ